MHSESGGLSSHRISSSAVWALTLLAFGITRIGILPMALDLRGDELLYQEWGLQVSSGSFPVGDDLYQYPPGAGLLFAAFNSSVGDFHRAFMLSVILADVVIFALLLLQMQRRKGSWRGPWTWIIGGFLAGGLLYERFDIFPTLMAVAAILVLSRPFLSGLLAGIGAMIKVWPIFVLFGMRRQDLKTGILGALVGIGSVLAIAFLAASHPLAFLTGQVERGLQIEASPAVPILIAAQLGLIFAPSVDRYGSTELDTALGGVVAWFGIVMAVFLIGIVLIQRLRGRLTAAPGPDVVLAVVLVFVAFNRVNSTQFFIWIAGVSAVALLDRRSRMLVPVMLNFLAMLPVAQYLGPFYWALQAQTLEAVTLQVLRALLVLASAVLAWWFVVSGRAYRDGPSEVNKRI